MGCGASKTNVVAPESTTIEARPKTAEHPTGSVVPVPSAAEPVSTAKDTTPPSPTPSQKSTSSRISVRSKQNSSRPGSGKGKSSLRKKFEKLKQDGTEVTNSYEGESNKVTRGPSAISTDSGVVEDPPSTCAILTEESSNSEEVAEAARPSTPDLTLQGTAIPSRKTRSATKRQLPPLAPRSLKGAAKSTSSPILPMDPSSTGDQEGPVSPRTARSISFTDSLEALSPQIIERPSSRGGMAFDLQFTPDPGNIKRTPSRLSSLDNKRKSKSADALRKELEERMVAAEARKKANEQMLLQRLAANKNKESKVQSVLAESVQSQSERTESLLSRRMESTQENREAHLKALRDRLQAKKEHGEKVRQAKMTPLLPPPGPALVEAS